MEDPVGPSSQQVLPCSTENNHDLNHALHVSAGGSPRHSGTARIVQMLIAELIGTYFLVFAGCTAILVNLNANGIITHPGVATVWGLVLMVMIYSVGHVSGAHFNPAVTIALASCRLVPLKQVPAYISVQILGSILASGTLKLLFKGNQNKFVGTLPVGSEMQSLLLEFIITFLFMFVISSLTTNNHSAKTFSGLAIGATLSINVFIAGPISGASVNPARSLGPAIISNQYKGLWIYIVGPISGATAGAWGCKLINLLEKSGRDIAKSESILRRSIHLRSN